MSSPAATADVIPRAAVAAIAGHGDASAGRMVPCAELIDVMADLEGGMRRVVDDLKRRIPTPAEAAGLLRACEQVSRASANVQLAVTLAADRAGVADVGKALDGRGRSEFKDTADYLVRTLKIRRGEALSRIRAARAFLPGESLTGAPLPSPFPNLAQAVMDGEVPASTAMMGVRTIEKLKPVLSHRPGGGNAELETLDKDFAEQARDHTPDIFKACLDRTEAHLDQDGLEPTDEMKRMLQGAKYEGKKFGLHNWRLTADDEQNELLKTVMFTQTNPRVHSTRETHEGDPAGETASPSSSWSGRSRAQKYLDGLVDACRWALAGGRLPASGGLKPQIMVTIDYQTLLGQLADTNVRTSTSTLQGAFSPRTIRRLACDAELIPVVLGGKGEVLDLGRSQRLFTREQRKALIARDGGCTGPECTVPPDWCESHHVTPWCQGGRTCVANGVLCCRWHHHLLHEGGWAVEMMGGVPWWVPPKHVDPAQKPLRNTFFRPVAVTALFD